MVRPPRCGHSVRLRAARLQLMPQSTLSQVPVARAGSMDRRSSAQSSLRALRERARGLRLILLLPVATLAFHVRETQVDGLADAPVVAFLTIARAGRTRAR